MLIPQANETFHPHGIYEIKKYVGTCKSKDLELAGKNLLATYN